MASQAAIPGPPTYSPPTTITHTPTTKTMTATGKDFLMPGSGTTTTAAKRQGTVSCAGVTAATATAISATAAGDEGEGKGRGNGAEPLLSPQSQLAQLLIQQQKQAHPHHHNTQSSNSTILSNSVACLSSTIAASGLVLLPPPPLTVKNLTIHTSLLSTKQHLLQQQQQLHQLHHAQLDAALKKQRQHQQQIQQQQQQQHQNQALLPPQNPPGVSSGENCTPGGGCGADGGGGLDEVEGDRRRENTSMGYVGHDGGSGEFGVAMSPSQPTSRSTTRVTSPVPGVGAASGGEGAQHPVNGNISAANNVQSLSPSKTGSSTYFFRGDHSMDHYPPPDQWTYTMTRYHASLIPLCEIEEPPTFYEAMDDHAFHPKSGDNISSENSNLLPSKRKEIDDYEGSKEEHEREDSFMFDDGEGERENSRDRDDGREGNENKAREKKNNIKGRLGDIHWEEDIEERHEEGSSLFLFSRRRRLPVTKPHYQIPDQRHCDPNRGQHTQPHQLLHKVQPHQQKQEQLQSEQQKQQQQHRQQLMHQSQHQQQQLQVNSLEDPGCDSSRLFSCQAPFDNNHKSNKHIDDNDNSTYTIHSNLHHHTFHDNHDSFPQQNRPDQIHSTTDTMTIPHASSTVATISVAAADDATFPNSSQQKHRSWEPSSPQLSPLIRHQKRRERTLGSSGEQIFFYDGPNLLHAKIYHDRDWNLDSAGTTGGQSDSLSEGMAALSTRAYAGTGTATVHSNEPLPNHSHGRSHRSRRHQLSKRHPIDSSMNGSASSRRSRSRSRSMSRSRSRSNSRRAVTSAKAPTISRKQTLYRTEDLIANGKVSVSAITVEATTTSAVPTTCEIDTSKLSPKGRSMTMSEGMLRKEQKLYSQQQQQHHSQYPDRNQDPQVPWMSYPSASLSAATGSKKPKSRPSILTRGFSADSGSRQDKKKNQQQPSPMESPKGGRALPLPGTPPRKATARERLVALVTRSTPPQTVAPLNSASPSWNASNDHASGRLLGTSIHSHQSGSSPSAHEDDYHHYQYQQQQQRRASSRQSHSPTILTQTHHRRQGSPTFVRSPESSVYNHTVGPSTGAGAGSYYSSSQQHHQSHQSHHRRQMSSPKLAEPVLGFPYNNSSLLTPADLHHHRSPPAMSPASPLAAFATVRGSSNSTDTSSSSHRRSRSQKPRPFSVATMEKVMSDHHHHQHHRHHRDRRLGGGGSGSEDNSEMDLNPRGASFHQGYHQYPTHPHLPQGFYQDPSSSKQRHMSAGAGGGGNGRPWTDILLLPITSLINITRTNSTVSSRTKDSHQPLPQGMGMDK
ncbi:hypothetical protein EMPS_05152 [Entomortierella parvispora]|uniref:Uncharacterized protein n=1 Tax=Entomortierella parvispora TaxID=205924 RepID=A0A9P3H9S9_9FUNG|nr:hypothetical protein EMPS_05152 [Entomortierella parvispora]